MSNIPIETLGQLLRYDAGTGKLYWLERSVEMFVGNWNKTAEQLCAWWNGRFAGREAFTADGFYGCKAGRIFGKSHYAHRVAWALSAGDWPASEIDHINGDRADNRMSNLRAVDHQANMQNKKVYASSTSGCHGVTFHKRMQRWQAKITINKKVRYLGTFDTRDAAVAARRLAEEASGTFHEQHGRAA